VMIDGDLCHAVVIGKAARGLNINNSVHERRKYDLPVQVKSRY
jgi:hypothetical protein